jgi:hypothetical protein
MKVYKLIEPIEYDGNLVEEIEIKRPKGKHVKSLDMGNVTKPSEIMSLAHALTDYTDSFFDELDGSDYLGVAGVIGDFLGSGQGT